LISEELESTISTAKKRIVRLVHKNINGVSLDESLTSLRYDENIKKYEALMVLKTLNKRRAESLYKKAKRLLMGLLRR